MRIPHLVIIGLLSSMTSALDLGQELAAKARSKAANEDKYQAQIDSLFNCPYDSIYDLTIKEVKVSDDASLMEKAKNAKSIAVSVKLAASWNPSWLEKFKTFLKSNNSACAETIPGTIATRAATNKDDCEETLSNDTADSYSENRLQIISFSRNASSWDAFKNGEFTNEGNCVGVRGVREECVNLDDISFFAAAKAKRKLTDMLELQNKAVMLSAINIRLKSGKIITLGDNNKPSFYEIRHPSYHDINLILSVTKKSGVSAGGIAYSPDVVTRYSSLFMEDDSISSDLDIIVPDSIVENLVSVFATAVGPTRSTYEQSSQEKNFIEEYLQKLRITKKSTSTKAIIAPPETSNDGDNKVKIHTRYGDITSDNDLLMFNGAKIDTEIYVDFMSRADTLIQIGDKDILVWNRGDGGTACPTLFRIFTISKSGFSTTEEFGSCSDIYTITYSKSDESIKINQNGYSGPYNSKRESKRLLSERYTYIFKNGSLRELKSIAR